MNIGIFGGSFDPVHEGHLVLARAAVDECCLNKVLFVPAWCSPHKKGGTEASSDDRLKMLQLAVQNNPYFEVLEIELKRKGLSYTVDTLREVKERYPAAELFLLMGGDCYQTLPDWKQPDEILKLARPVVVQREDSRVVLRPKERAITLRMDPVAVSATAIRGGLMRGKRLGPQMLPEAVENYINQHHLYQS